MTPHVIIDSSHAVKSVVSDITVNQKVVNGTLLLSVYYSIVFLFFVMDFIVVQSQRTDSRKAGGFSVFGFLKRAVMRFYLTYRRHGLITVNGILYVICLCFILYGIGWNWHIILAVSASFLVFLIAMRFILKIFVGEGTYENEMIIRYINLIFYILLGNYYCFFMRFVSTPNLVVSFTGLLFALYLCFNIMLYAIFNPKILTRITQRNTMYAEAYGIIKGMLAVLLFMLMILYMMVFSCWITNPRFYTASYPRTLDAWDMLYYLIITFATIGYGDIIPVRFDGMYYSEFTAMIIGLASMFTTACFAAAVISTANSVAKTTREQKRRQIMELEQHKELGTRAPYRSVQKTAEHARSTKSEDGAPAKEKDGTIQ